MATRLSRSEVELDPPRGARPHLRSSPTSLRDILPAPGSLAGNKFSLLAAILLLTCAGCASPVWDGTVDRWGTLREVLREGDTSGKVPVCAVLSPGAHGIGALEGLEGEILITKGEAWIGTGNETPGTITTRRALLGDEAAFLAVAEVVEWSSVTVDRPLTEESLGALIRLRLSGTRFAHAPVVPVRVEGLIEWDGHILAGHCPQDPNPPKPGAGPPLELSGTGSSPVTLVGFLADLPPGELTHHGSRFHLHALREEPTWAVAHVDKFTVLPGARVLLPAGEHP